MPFFTKTAHTIPEDFFELNGSQTIETLRARIVGESKLVTELSQYLSTELTEYKTNSQRARVECNRNKQNIIDELTNYSYTEQGAEAASLYNSDEVNDLINKFDEAFNNFDRMAQLSVLAERLILHVSLLQNSSFEKRMAQFTGKPRTVEKERVKVIIKALQSIINDIDDGITEFKRLMSEAVEKLPRIDLSNCPKTLASSTALFELQRSTNEVMNSFREKLRLADCAWYLDALNRSFQLKGEKLTSNEKNMRLIAKECTISYALSNQNNGYLKDYVLHTFLGLSARVGSRDIFNTTFQFYLLSIAYGNEDDDTTINDAMKKYLENYIRQNGPLVSLNLTGLPIFNALISEEIVSSGRIKYKNMLLRAVHGFIGLSESVPSIRFNGISLLDIVGLFLMLDLINYGATLFPITLVEQFFNKCITLSDTRTFRIGIPSLGSDLDLSHLPANEYLLALYCILTDIRLDKYSGKQTGPFASLRKNSDLLQKWKVLYSAVQIKILGHEEATPYVANQFLLKRISQRLEFIRSFSPTLSLFSFQEVRLRLNDFVYPEKKKQIEKGVYVNGKKVDRVTEIPHDKAGQPIFDETEIKTVFVIAVGKTLEQIERDKGTTRNNKVLFEQEQKLERIALARTNLYLAEDFLKHPTQPATSSTSNEEPQEYRAWERSRNAYVQLQHNLGLSEVVTLKQKAFTEVFRAATQVGLVNIRRKQVATKESKDEIGTYVFDRFMNKPKIVRVALLTYVIDQFAYHFTLGEDGALLTEGLLSNLSRCFNSDGRVPSEAPSISEERIAHIAEAINQKLETIFETLTAASTTTEAKVSLPQEDWNFIEQALPMASLTALYDNLAELYSPESLVTSEKVTEAVEIKYIIDSAALIDPMITGAATSMDLSLISETGSSAITLDLITHAAAIASEKCEQVRLRLSNLQDEQRQQRLIQVTPAQTQQQITQISTIIESISAAHTVIVEASVKTGPRTSPVTSSSADAHVSQTVSTHASEMTEVSAALVDAESVNPDMQSLPALPEMSALSVGVSANISNADTSTIMLESTRAESEREKEAQEQPSSVSAEDNVNEASSSNDPLLRGKSSDIPSTVERAGSVRDVLKMRTLKVLSYHFQETEKVGRELNEEQKAVATVLILVKILLNIDDKKDTLLQRLYEERKGKHVNNKLIKVFLAIIQQIFIAEDTEQKTYAMLLGYDPSQQEIRKQRLFAKARELFDGRLTENETKLSKVVLDNRFMEKQKIFESAVLKQAQNYQPSYVSAYSDNISMLNHILSDRRLGRRATELITRLVARVFIPFERQLYQQLVQQEALLSSTAGRRERTSSSMDTAFPSTSSSSMPPLSVSSSYEQVAFEVYSPGEPISEQVTSFAPPPPPPPPAVASPAPVISSNRLSLLNSIQIGTALRPPKPKEVKAASVASDGNPKASDLGNILINAVQGRRPALDDDSDSENSSDENWSEDDTDDTAFSQQQQSSPQTISGTQTSHFGVSSSRGTPPESLPRGNTADDPPRLLPRPGE